MEMRIVGIIFFFVFFSSCGYHFGDGSPLSLYRSFTVPYICGDKTGEFTAALIKELSCSGSFSYRSKGAELVFKVTLVDLCDENIGYRYDINKRGKTTHSLIPAETRLTVCAEVLVMESCSCTPVLGPIRLQASVDFDHEYYFIRQGVNVSSLGQVTDYDQAYEAALPVLSKVLAKKIIDYVLHGSW